MDVRRVGNRKRKLRLLRVDHVLQNQLCPDCLKAREARENRYAQLSQYGSFRLIEQLDTAKRSSREKYQSYFENENYLTWDNASRKRKAYEKAADNADRLQTSLLAYGSEVYEYYFYLRRTDIELLKEEGLANNDAFIAVTDSSETNVLTCLHARRFGIKKTIALVENTGFINISQDIGIDTIINKKLITASYIARFIVKGDAVSSKWLSGTNAELIEFVVGRHAPATRVPIGELRLPEGKATIGGIIRGRETLLPTRDTQLREMDKVVVFALPNAMDKVAKLFD